MEGRGSGKSPNKVQVKLLAANPKNVLIAHQPGEGKTVSAVLFAERKRNEFKATSKKPRILLIAPSADILLQWQETVKEWGYSTKHWIFQTLALFHMTRTKRGYPEYESLHEDVRNVFEETQDYDKYNDKEVGMKVGADVAEYFNDQLSTKDAVREYIKESIFDQAGKKYRKFSDFTTIEFVSVYSSKKGKYINLQKYFLKNREETLDKFAEYRENLAFYVTKNTLKVLSDLLWDEENEAYPPYPGEGWIGKKKKETDENDGYDFTGLKKTNIKYILGLQPQINYVDTFSLPDAHPKGLVEHRYKAETGTIIIIDECHKALSSDKSKPQTQALFQYSFDAPNKILVSATPMMTSKNVFQKLRTAAQFLEDDENMREKLGVYDQDKEYESAYNQVLGSLYGKLSMVVYRDENTSALIDALKTTTGARYIEQHDEVMKRRLFGVDVNWEYFKDIELKKNSVSKGGTTRLDRIKTALVKASLLDCFVVKNTDIVNPFPTKKAYMGGYIKVYRDKLRQYLSTSNDFLIDKSDEVNGEYTFDKLTFNLQKMRELRKKAGKEWYFPIVVEYNDEVQQQIAMLWKFAYACTDRFIAILYEDEDYETQLKNYHIHKYDANNPLKQYEQAKNVSDILKAFDDDMKKYFETATAGDVPQWRHLSYRQENAHCVTNVPGILSSKLKQIVIFVEECVAQHKNVIVYHKNISVLNALEQAFLMRQNRKIRVGMDDSAWIEGMMSRKKEKWERWDDNSIEREKKHICERCKEKEYAFCPKLIDNIDTEVGEKEKYTYLQRVRNNKVDWTRKLKKPTYASDAGVWTTEDDEMYFDTPDVRYFPVGDSEYKKTEYSQLQKVETIASILNSIMDGDMVKKAKKRFGDQWKKPLDSYTRRKEAINDVNEGYKKIRERLKILIKNADKTSDPSELLKVLDEIVAMMRYYDDDDFKRSEYVKRRERVAGMVQNKVSFGTITGAHAVESNAVDFYKTAFEAGVVDCLLMNDKIIEGINFKSTRESVCIGVEPFNSPEKESQFVGRLVRRYGHDVCPREFRNVQYVSFVDRVRQVGKAANIGKNKLDFRVMAESESESESESDFGPGSESESGLDVDWGPSGESDEGESSGSEASENEDATPDDNGGESLEGGSLEYSNNYVNVSAVVVIKNMAFGTVHDLLSTPEYKYVCYNCSSRSDGPTCVCTVDNQKYFHYETPELDAGIPKDAFKDTGSIDKYNALLEQLQKCKMDLMMGSVEQTIHVKENFTFKIKSKHPDKDDVEIEFFQQLSPEKFKKSVPNFTEILKAIEPNKEAPQLITEVGEQIEEEYYSDN